MWSAVRVLSAIAMTTAVLAMHSASARATEVDLLLALTADVSRSVDEQKFNLQREGYSQAITSPRVIEAIRSGRLGRTAVCYIEWSSSLSQKVLIDWTVIQNDASVHRFSSQLAETPRAFADLTSTSGEIDFAMTQIERAPFRVIDISGDSDDNNAGREVMDVRDEAPAKGPTINALVVLSDQLPLGALGSDRAAYYCGHLLGELGAFVIVAKDYGSFGRAIINKFVAEITGLRVSHAEAGHPNKTTR